MNVPVLGLMAASMDLLESDQSGFFFRDRAASTKLFQVAHTIWIALLVAMKRL